MKRGHKWAMGVGLLLSFCSGPKGAEASPTSEWIAAGDRHFVNRYDEQRVWKAIANYRQALKKDPKDYIALWKTARAYGWLANDRKSKAETRKVAERGLSYAHRAVRQNPKGVEGQFYAALCVGYVGRSIPMIMALFKGIEKKVLTFFRTARRIDPKFEGGGADRALGVYYHTVPWPKRDRSKALQHLNRALGFGPNNPWNHYYLAEVLLAEDRKKLARKFLLRCIGLREGQAGKAVLKRVQPRCRTLLRKI
jgi:tetratricopeptide (TPR) repeat protein